MPVDRSEYQKKYRARNKKRVRTLKTRWNDEHPDKAAAYSKKWREENKDKCRAYTKAYRARHPRMLRASQAFADYGITPEEHDSLLDKQDRRCAFPACGVAVDLSSPIDHDHVTGRVRGILCWDHNKGLGFFEKRNLECLINAHDYLQRETKTNVSC